MTRQINFSASMKEIFDRSLFAAAAADRVGRIIYKNKRFSDIFGDSMPVIPALSSDPAEQYICVGLSEYKLFTTPTEECVIAVIIPCRNEPDSTMEDIYAWERHMLSAVAAASDNIAGADSGRVHSESLDAIESSVMVLHSKMMVTEQTGILTKKNQKDFEPVSVSEQIKRFAAELTESLADCPAEIGFTCKGGLFSRCDIKSVILFASDFVGRAAGGGIFPESIDIKLSDMPQERVILTVGCKFSPAENGKPLSVRERASCFNALSEILGEKCGCSINEQLLPDAAVFTANMPEYTGIRTVKAPRPKFKDVSLGRFSDVNVMLAAGGIRPSIPGRKDNQE
ncbi:MAG: hypothetical protein NC078_11520 [Ruminococcus sp.]|nr:hypothetical protein [Ruminococcus sp.]